MRLSADQHVSYLQEYVVGWQGAVKTQITSLLAAESGMDAHISLTPNLCVPIISVFHYLT